MKVSILIFLPFAICLLLIPSVFAISNVSQLSNSDVLNAVFSPDGSMLAIMTAKGVHLYDAGGLMPITFLETRNPEGFVSFSPDGAFMATGGDDNTVRIWDMKSRLEIATLSGHKGKITSVKFSPDNKVLASGSEDCTVKLWDTKTRFLITTLRGHKKPILFIDFNIPANMILTGDEDGRIMLWDYRNYKELATFKERYDWELSENFNQSERMVFKRIKFAENLKVNELKVPQTSIRAGDTSVIETVAEYTGDKTALSFQWSASAGNIQGTGNKAVYKAPDVPGSYSINVRATDGAISSERTAEINVAEISDKWLVIDKNRHWPASAFKDKLSYNVNITKVTGGKVILHFDITQDKDEYDSFLSIEIGQRIVLEDMAIGNEQPSTGIRTIRDLDVSDIITSPGTYTITLYIRPGDRTTNGWLLNEASLSGVEGAITTK